MKFPPYCNADLLCPRSGGLRVNHRVNTGKLGRVNKSLGEKMRRGKLR